MKKLLLAILAGLFAMAWGCSDDDKVVAPKANENDMSVLREIYDNAQMGRSLWYPEQWNMFNPDPYKMYGTKWENIGGELRVVSIDLGGRTNEPHELTPRIGELTYLRNLTYMIPDVTGAWPREIYNCPLETLKLWGERRGGEWQTSGGIYPEISKVANTLRFLEIINTDIGLDSKGLECVFECKNLDHLVLRWDNLKGEVPAYYGDFDFSQFWLDHNNFTSIDVEIFRSKGSAFPVLMSNDIYCEIPEWAVKTKKWEDNNWKLQLNKKIILPPGYN